MNNHLVFLILGVLTAGAMAQRRPPNYHQHNMPSTSFSCRDKIIGGYYADPETDCQMFHVCAKVPEGVQDFRFLCPNDTSFDQENQICDDWFNIDCESNFIYSDNFDLYRLGSESSRDIKKPSKATPIALGPTSVKPFVPSFNRQKQFTGGNSIDEEDNFLRSDTGDRRLQNDLLRGSSSSNFYANKNGRDDYVDNDPAVIVKQQDVNKGTNDFEKKKNNKSVRKLLTGKRPIANTPNAINNNDQTVSRNKPNYPHNSYTQAQSTATQTQPPSTTPTPTEATTQYVRPKNSNLRFRGNINYGSPKNANDVNGAVTNAAVTNAATVTQPTVDYYKKTSTKPSYNKNVYNANQPQNYNASIQQNYNVNQNYNNNQNFNANQQVNYNNGQTAATYNTNQQTYNNGFNQQAYNVNNLQSTSVDNQNSYTQTYNVNNGPTQVPLDYFKKTSVKQTAYKQTGANKAQSQPIQQQTTPNYAEYYRTSTVPTTTTLNYNEFDRTSTAPVPSTSFNYNEYYRTSTNAPTTQFNYNEYYRTSTNAAANNANYDEYYRTSSVAPSTTTFNYNEYYRTSAAAVPTSSSAGTFYDPYNSYKEKFLANQGYEEDTQDEFLKTAPSSNLKPSDINAFSKAYLKPVSFNASLTAKINYNTKAETTVKPATLKASQPTQQTYYQQPVVKQTSQTPSQVNTQQQQKTAQTPLQQQAQQQKQQVQQKQVEAKKDNVPQAQAPVVVAQTQKTLSLEEYKKILEIPSDYDYAYYGGGDDHLNLEYDGIERIPEEFSKTKNIKKA